MDNPAAYCTVAELRWQYPDLVSETKYPDTTLAAAITFAEQWFEAAAHVAYVRRTVTETLTGSGTTRLFLSARVEVSPPTAITVDGVAFTPDELAAVVTRKDGILWRAARWPKGATIEVTYTHGYAAPVELAKQAVMMLAAEKALPSTVPLRATSLSTDVGSYRISQADKTGKTGIPEVDAIIGLLGAEKPVTG